MRSIFKSLTVVVLTMFVVIPLYAGDPESTKIIKEIQQLEKVYNNADLKFRETAKTDFAQYLLNNLGNSNRTVRRRATYLLNVYFADDREILIDLLDILDPNKFFKVTAAERINAMHLITEAGEQAWTPELLNEANQRLRRISQHSPNDLGKDQTKYLNKLRDRVNKLHQLPSTTWAFGTLQERGPKTTAFTDIDVFVCEDSQEDHQLVLQSRKLAELLAKENFGRVRLRIWPSEGSIPISELKPHSTLYFDENHPEAKEIGRVKKIFGAVDGLPPIRFLPNTGKQSGWYLSLFICP